MTAPSPLSDAATRRRIGPWHRDTLPVLDDFEPETNFVVRAAAGSGKTTALVARIVALVRRGVPIDECTAITFTRKASSEMKARLYRELRTVDRRLREAPGTAPNERRRIQRALRSLPHCFIGTIHAFCARLLRERPLAAGLSPDFTAGIDERDREDLRAQTWQSYLSDRWRSDPDRVKRIASLGIEPAELVSFFGELCRYPDLEPYVDGPDTPPDLDSPTRELQDFVKTWIDALPQDPADGDATPGTAAEAFRTAQRFLTFRTLDDPATKAEFISLFEGITTDDNRKSTDTNVRGDITKGHWLDSHAAERLDNELLPALARETVEPALRQWKAYVHRELVEFTRPAVERYAERRRETGQLTFQDLLVRARTLLRDDPAARRALQAEYPRLLVDEFQDTDPIQAELLFFLASRDPTEREWRECTPRDGSLFIVGDDKQSIYRFRRADLDVYRTVREAIDRAPNGDDVTLESNFRSVPSLLDWCNATFDSLFGNVEPPYQAPYVAFDAARPEESHGPAVRQLTVPYVNGASSTRDIAGRNAEQIADYIADVCTNETALLHDETGTPLVPGTPGDFMILTRNTTRLDLFAEALADRGLPYTLSGGGDLNTSTELWALLTLLTCVERPQDSVARIAYLRGPIVGLSDDELYRYSEAGGAFDGSFDLPTTVADELGADLTSRLNTAFRHLRTSHKWLHTLRPAAAIERIVDRLGLMARARRDEGLGSLHAGRLLRVLTEVQRLDAEGHTWTAIREELQQVLDGDREIDGMTLETGSTEAIRLLNVHKAKGLEAPVVFLADPYGRSHPKPPDEHVRRNEGEVVLPVYEEHRYHRTLRYAPERWATEFEDTEARYQQAEEHRLLYVAATRAESMLVVSRYRSDRWTEEKGYWAPLYPHLEDCPELECPPESPKDEPPPGDAEPFALDGDEIERRRARVAHSSYQTRSVTDESGSAPSPVTGGYGTDFGEAIHELFAYAVRHRATLTPPTLSDDLIAAALAEHDEESRLVLARDMTRDFLTGPVWAALTSAETVHVEYPVGGVDEQSQDGPEVVSGKIDLLYRTEAGWHLIDYKTDRVPDDPSTLIDAYCLQLETYAELWEAATGEEIAETGLWLADMGTLVTL